MANVTRCTLRSVVAMSVQGSDWDGALEGIAKSVHRAEDRDATARLIAEHSPQLVVVRETDDGGVIDLLTELRADFSDTPIVIVTDKPTVEGAVEFIRAGAYDYLSGPADAVTIGRLADGLEIEETRAAQNHQRFFSKDCPPGVPAVGRSEGMVRTLEMLSIVSESRCNPILLLGETGTGKELAARAVHAWRCGDPADMVAVNCATLTANLLESELFGHVKGAFTGADTNKTGLFEVAGSGSIFLDEISEMPSALQAKLLRVLQEKRFRKVGGTRDIACNATIIASSNRDLFAEVQAGKFRQDLYYRLAVFPISIPPLRSESRREDIGLLAEYFLETSSVVSRGQIEGLSESAVRKLQSHHWPGNVRELRNVIDRAIIMSKGGQIRAEDLLIHPEASVTGTADERRDDATHPKDFSLETAEREFIVRALKETGWQRTRAAALLGITRATLHAKLKRYDIQPPGSRPEQPSLPAAAPAASSGAGLSSN